MGAARPLPQPQLDKEDIPAIVLKHKQCQAIRTGLIKLHAKSFLFDLTGYSAARGRAEP